jgi:DNA-binding Xre family transcriptional regulator
MSFYELFEIALEKKHMNTAEICAKTGLYPSYFSKLKKGEFKDVTWERALMIIDALEMTPDEFKSLSK